MLQSIYNIEISWSFFATSHGKGAVDGIGATVKRSVWTQINILKNIKIIYKDKETVNDSRNQLTEKWKHTPNIPKLQTQHHHTSSSNIE